ncbi:MAG: DNA replication/repair protein RecF [Bacteroidota bacterium]
MRLKNLRLENFRNHDNTRLVHADNANVFLGDNGEGKTNILEAISYLCLSKSFYAANDRIAAQIGKDYFIIEGEFCSDRDVDFFVRVTYNTPNAEKKFLINNAEVETLASVVGRFPVVILSPESGATTTGSPADRRKFIDLVISQASRVYLQTLLEYRKALKQRNKILLDAKVTRRDCTDIIEPWDKSIIDLGTQITLKRQGFFQGFIGYVQKAFEEFVGELEIPGIDYVSSIPLKGNDSAEQVKKEFEKQLQVQQAEERRMGMTLVGPHRDEIEFTLNGLALRKFASQGQHKTFLVALKAAEFYYLKEQCNETPLLLLDDVFSELDEYRSQRVLHLVQNVGQTFITSSSEHMFPAGFEWGGTTKKFSVKQGTVLHEEASNVLR